MNIPEMYQEIKNVAGDVLSEWGVVTIVVLVALASFGLGRLSVLIDAQPLVTVAAAPLAARLPSMPLGGLVVASRSGSVYYYPWCAGASKIAIANQRWFTSEKEAQAAGYRPAKNCKGLGRQ